MRRKGHVPISSEVAPRPRSSSSRRTVAGRVLDAGGLPAGGALLAWSAASPQPDLALRADRDGRFRLAQAPRDAFELRAFLGSQQAVAEIAAGGDVENLTLRLEEKRA